MPAGNTTRRLCLAFLIIAMLMTGFSVSAHSGMEMRMDGQMADCPFMPGATICPMTPMEMIAASQYLFAALPQQKDVATILALALAVLAGVLLWRPLAFPRPAPRPVFNIRAHQFIPLSNPLQEAFASGILNPKPY